MLQSNLLAPFKFADSRPKSIRGQFPRGHLADWILIVMFLAGCGGGGSIDVNVAKKSLETTLNSWKEGKSPGDLTSETPPIKVIDADWEKGNKLVEYEIVKEEKTGDHSLLVTANLKLEPPKGKPTTPVARYIINTVPEITVFRKVGP